MPVAEGSGPYAALPDEAALRAGLPVFVNSFEQFTYLRDTVEWFHRHGFCNVTVMEQGSTHAGLLDWLASDAFTSKARLQRLRRNVGPRRAVRKAAAQVGLGQAFVFTDPDLGLPDPPDANMIGRMLALGRAYDVTKVGLALDIHDTAVVNVAMPMGRHSVGSYQRRFYRNAVEPGLFLTGVDTTFFLYVPRPAPVERDILSSQPRLPALRVAWPGFLALHRPWCFDNGMPAEEEAHYRRRTSIASTLFGRGTND